MFGISDREYEELQRENERYIREQMKIDNAVSASRARQTEMDCDSEGELETSDGGSVGGSDSSDDEVEVEEEFARPIKRQYYEEAPTRFFRNKSRINPPLCSTSRRVKMIGVRGGGLPAKSTNTLSKSDPPLANMSNNVKTSKVPSKTLSTKSTKTEKVAAKPSVLELATPSVATPNESDEDTAEKHNDLEYEEKRYYGKSNCFLILISTDMTMVKVRNILAKHCNDPNFVKIERFKGDIEKYKPTKKGVIEYVKGTKAKHMHAYFTTTKIMKPSRICEILVESGVMLSLEPDSKRVTAYDYK